MVFLVKIVQNFKFSGIEVFASFDFFGCVLDSVSSTDWSDFGDGLLQCQAWAAQAKI